MFTAFIKNLPVGELPTHSHTGNINTKNLSGTFISKSVERDSSGIVSNISTNKVGNSSGGSGNTGTEYTINASHTHTIVINNIGSSQAHNNIQPYIAVYIWKRIT